MRLLQGSLIGSVRDEGRRASARGDGHRPPLQLKGADGQAPIGLPAHSSQWPRVKLRFAQELPLQLREGAHPREGNGMQPDSARSFSLAEAPHILLRESQRFPGCMPRAVQPSNRSSPTNRVGI